MQKLILILTVLTAAVPLRSQETRTEITKATTPAEDSKANSSAVPDVYVINGKFERIVILRFKHQADLLAGLEKMMTREKIRNAVILSGIGSVRGYHIHTVSNREFPSKDIFVKNPAAPADLVSMNGYVIDGRVHAHVTLANPDKAFGGHLESGTEVFTFAVVTVGVLNGKADLSRLDDKTHR
jgi:predicted DNA-binding protein with PD1-like motif